MPHRYVCSARTAGDLVRLDAARALRSPLAWVALVVTVVGWLSHSAEFPGRVIGVRVVGLLLVTCIVLPRVLRAVDWRRRYGEGTVVLAGIERGVVVVIEPRRTFSASLTDLVAADVHGGVLALKAHQGEWGEAPLAALPPDEVAQLQAAAAANAAHR